MGGGLLEPGACAQMGGQVGQGGQQCVARALGRGLRWRRRLLQIHRQGARALSVAEYSEMHGEVLRTDWLIPPFIIDDTLLIHL